MEKFGFTMGIFVTFFIAVFFLAVVRGVFVYFLWSPVAVDIFGAPAISFWQAVGISYLSAVLFHPVSASTNSKKS